MKKFSHKKVPYTIEVVGYGVYKVTAKYKAGYKTAISTDSPMYDYVDDDDLRKQRVAIRHFTNLIKNQNR